jgi:predicted ATP-grasp superfamily ATP-dependent carboligase
MGNLKKINYSNPVPVILGGFVNGLGLIRSFWYAGIPTICLDKKKDIALYSKYTVGLICPDPELEEKEFIGYLINIGKKLKQKGMLFATNDIWLIPISKNRYLLSKYYLFPMSDWDVIEKCFNKTQLYKIAEENGIPVPKTFFLDTILDIEKIRDKIIFPCVLKPSIPIGFLEKLGSSGRTIVISNPAELKFWEKRIIQAKMINVPLIIQEQITGPVENLYTLTAYSNINADVIAYSTGHKIRQSPPDAGTILSGRVKKEPEVYELGSRLIKILGFYGISNTEFKKDVKDNKFKLIEINPRPGMWNYSVLKSGVNLPYIAYKEMLGKKFEGKIESGEGKVWIVLLSDLFSSVLVFKRNGHPKHSISFKEWLDSINGEKVYAIASLSDFIPFMVYILRFLTHIMYFLFIKRLLKTNPKNTEQR